MGVAAYQLLGFRDCNVRLGKTQRSDHQVLVPGGLKDLRQKRHSHAPCNCRLCLIQVVHRAQEQLNQHVCSISYVTGVFG